MTALLSLKLYAVKCRYAAVDVIKKYQLMNVNNYILNLTIIITQMNVFMNFLWISDLMECF